MVIADIMVHYTVLWYDLGRQKRSDEILNRNAILRQFPEEDSISWSKLWRKCQETTKSKSTFVKYLREFESVGLVRREGKRYRLSHSFGLWKVPPYTELRWPSTGSTVDDEESFLSHLELDLTMLVSSYFEMLETLVEVESESDARELVSVFFQGLNFEGLLTILAIQVWRKRESVSSMLDELAWKSVGGLYVKLKSALELGIVRKPDSPRKKVAPVRMKSANTSQPTK